MSKQQPDRAITGADQRVGWVAVALMPVDALNLAELFIMSLPSTHLRGLERFPSVVALYSLHTALQGLSLGEMLRESVAAGAELEGLLHPLEHLLVVAERDPFCLSLESSP